MLHNPEDYPDPERFNPDRFIKNGKLNPDVRDPTTVAFGFGRRYVIMISIMSHTLSDVCDDTRILLEFVPGGG